MSTDVIADTVEADVSPEPAGLSELSFDDEELKRKKQLNLGGPNPNTEDEVMLIRTRVSRIYFLKKFFDYPVSLKWKTLKNMGLLRTIKVGFSYLKAIILKRKENSLEDFYINRFGEELYKMFFRSFYKCNYKRYV